MKYCLLAGILILPPSFVTAGDVTESPFLIDPGSWLVEVDAVRWARDREEGTTLQSLTVGETFIVRGLARGAELQIIAVPYSELDYDYGAGRQRISGPGDIDLRANIRLVADGEERFGASLIPYVSLPVGRNGIGRGERAVGLIVPAAWNFSSVAGLTAMAGIDLQARAIGRGYDGLFFTSASLDFSWTERLGGYAELYAERETRHSAPWATSLNLGGVFQLGENLELTAGYNIGLTNIAVDHEAFLRIGRLW